MNKWMKVSAAASLMIVLLAVQGTGQPANPPAGAAAPEMAVPIVNPLVTQTRLEKFLLQTGAVVTKGYTEVGTIQCNDGVTIRVLALELSDATHGGDKLYGVSLQVRSSARDPRAAESYVDDDGIDELAKALQSLAAMNRSSTKMANFSAHYRGVGGLEIHNVDNNGVRLGAVRSVQVDWATGQISDASAELPVGRLEEVRRQVLAAKERIDSMKGK